VLHVPSYRRMLWTHPCALVATIHDLAPFHLPGKYDAARMFYGRVVARQLASRQDAIIAVSQTTVRDIVKFFRLPEQRLTMIYNGLDRMRFVPGCHATAKKQAESWYGLRQPFFLYTARLEHPAKNHVRLIEAFNRLKAGTKSSWHLVLVGGDWHGAEFIHEAVRRSPFRESIHCIGFVPDDELANFYQAADVFVYPSLYEGFGFPPLEAMSCGCPVLSSRRGALDEVVGTAAATADPEDIDAMKSQMARLAGDESLRETLRAAGLKHAARFDWDHTARQTMKVYSEAAGQTQPTSSPVNTQASSLEWGV